MTNSDYHSQIGLTFLEVMVVIAIASILLAIAAPSFTGTTQRFRALAEANELVRDMQFARSEAIDQGLPVTICASIDSATCSSASDAWHKGWIVFADPTASKIVGTNPLIRIQKRWTGSDTFTADNSTSSITFSREGFTLGLPGTGTVTFTLHTNPLNSAATQCVAIIKTGRVQIQSAGMGTCS